LTLRAFTIRQEEATASPVRCIGEADGRCAAMTRPAGAAGRRSCGRRSR